MGDSIQHERELREQWQSLHLRSHESQELALQVAREEVNRRLNGMNELREQINTERSEFVRRDVYDREHLALRESTDQRLKQLENTRSNIEGRLWAIGAAISVLVVGIQIIMRFIK